YILSLHDALPILLINQDVEIYQSMIKAVELKPVTMVADYTINQQYLNVCRYFGQLYITFNDWIDNINHFPNVIFHIETVAHLMNQYQIHNAFDLALLSLLQDNIVIDIHFVFNFIYYFIIIILMFIYI